MVVLGDEAPAPVCDGGYFSVVAVGVFHNVGSAKADSDMADDAACFACGAADGAG